MDYAGKTVWIIGASSGIGYALAIELNRRGASLILSARNGEALNNLNTSLGGHHHCVPLDITDEPNFFLTFSNIASHDIDSAIYLAADYKPGKIADITASSVGTILAVNLQGVFTFLREIIPYFKKRGTGQIALCGSVAGYIGLPGGQPYSATKAAIINLAESLRAELSDENIDVKLISPGFVKTPLTEKNNFFMPMIIEPDEAARAIADGLLTKRFEIRFPKFFTALMKILQTFPYRLYFSLAKNLR